jgi:predicted ATPase
MPEQPFEDAKLIERAERGSIVQYFGIKGLYGYRSISLESEYAATILIAKNGTGKTTLLGALDAFLKMQFHRLQELQFDAIHCSLRGIPEELVLRRISLEEFLDCPTDGEVARLARRLDVEITVLFTFLLDEYPALRTEYRAQLDNKIFSSLLRQSQYDRAEVSALCDRLRAELFARVPEIARINNSITQALDGCEVVYLPTYRRVELALRGEPADARRRRPRFNVGPGSLFTGDIAFGLSDISERLSEMNQEVLIASNNGYREISANIINELIDGNFESELKTNKKIPGKDELTLFFERLRDGRDVGQYYHVNPNVDKIYSQDGVPHSSAQFLNYFLSKLGTVIGATHDVDLKVEEFVHNCNKYLSTDGEIPFGVLDTRSEKTEPRDGKVLRLNRRNLKVHVESLPGHRRISLDALSSGEKQMISLFAKLFLYPQNKIVLIDEPELSLSIDWQRTILVDVLNSPLCAQVIAITHSPFVFDNDLEPFAKALRVSLDQEALARLPAGSDIDE